MLRLAAFGLAFFALSGCDGVDQGKSLGERQASSRNAVPDAYPSLEKRKQIALERAMNAKNQAEKHHGKFADRLECDGIKNNGEVKDYRKCIAVSPENSNIALMDIEELAPNSRYASEASRYIRHPAELDDVISGKWKKVSLCLGGKSHDRNIIIADSDMFEECYNEGRDLRLYLTMTLKAMNGARDLQSASALALREEEANIAHLESVYRPRLNQLIARRKAVESNPPAPRVIYAEDIPL